MKFRFLLRAVEVMADHELASHLTFSALSKEEMSVVLVPRVVEKRDEGNWS